MQETFDKFYTSHARRYAEVTHEFIQAVYSNVSHSGLTSDLVIIDRMKELIPSQASGLDAGCGAGARDVFFTGKLDTILWELMQFRKIFAYLRSFIQKSLSVYLCGT